MPTKYKGAVIGVGNMGSNHLRVLSELPSVELLSFSEINRPEGEIRSKEYGVNHYESYEKMIEEEGLDFVCICTPTSTHYKIASYCLRNGLHVLLEKPITSRAQEGARLIRLAKDKKLVLMVGHIERYNPAVIKTKELIEDGSLGKIVAIIARRVGGFPPQIKDANIAVDLAIHDIDIVNYLMNSLPFDTAVNFNKNHIKKRSDSVEIFLKYKGASAYIQSNWITPVKIRSLSITGTEGYLDMDYINQRIELYKSNYDKFKENSKNFSDFILKFSEPDKITIDVAKKEPLKEEISSFLLSIGGKISVDSSYAVNALRIALKK